jgi:hypothetical protein
LVFCLSSSQVSFVDHTKVYDPSLPSNLPVEFQTSVNVSTSPLTRIEPTFLSRPISRKSLHQLKLITSKSNTFFESIDFFFFPLKDELQENKVNQTDHISISPNRKNSTAPSFKHIPRLSSFDESLTDEDAWMSILDVVNTEV